MLPRGRPRACCPAAATHLLDVPQGEVLAWRLLQLADLGTWEGFEQRDREGWARLQPQGTGQALTRGLPEGAIRRGTSPHQKPGALCCCMRPPPAG